MNKLCRRCNTEKPLSDFRKASKEKDGYQYSCKKCSNEDTKKWRKKNYELEKERARIRRHSNLDKHNATTRRWRENNPDKVKALHLKKKYNLTLDQWNSMFLEQQGKCKVCETHQDNLEKELAVDHCHKTGKIRGLLCVRCNRAIGLLEDRIDLLEKSINHLRQYEE